jgi:hypothetical protein
VEVARILSSLASLLAERGMLQGRYQDAEPLLEQGLDLGETALGPDDPARGELQSAVGAPRATLLPGFTVPPAQEP